MVGLLAVTVTEGLALSVFQNTTEEMMFIRKIRQTLILSAAEPDEFLVSQLSKQRSLVTGDGASGFNLHTEIAVPATGATPDDGSIAVNEVLQYAKGELTLEPNEELFLNMAKSSGGEGSFLGAVGHHF